MCRSRVGGQTRPCVVRMRILQCWWLFEFHTWNMTKFILGSYEIFMMKIIKIYIMKLFKLITTNKQLRIHMALLLGILEKHNFLEKWGFPPPPCLIYIFRQTIKYLPLNESLWSEISCYCNAFLFLMSVKITSSDWPSRNGRFRLSNSIIQKVWIIYSVDALALS